MSTKRELSFVLPNQPGSLAAATAALARRKVNLLALDAAGGFEYNIVRIVTDNAARAKRILEREGYEVGQTKVLCLWASDTPGALARIAQKLARAKINVDYLYATGGAPARRP
ncbi:acetolactate synthase [bacterium]|nr:acetolactate synthase [bacterium]